MKAIIARQAKRFTPQQRRHCQLVLFGIIVALAIVDSLW